MKSDRTKLFKRIISLLLIIMAGSIIVAILTKPAKPDLQDISYEKISAKVVTVDVRKVKDTKYTYKNYYDISLESDAGDFVWTTSLNNPNMKVGEIYNFFLCDGIVYRTEAEMQNNLKIINSSILFRASVFLIIVSCSACFVFTLINHLETKKKVGE